MGNSLDNNSEFAERLLLKELNRKLSYKYMDSIIGVEFLNYLNISIRNDDESALIHLKMFEVCLTLGENLRLADKFEIMEKCRLINSISNDAKEAGQDKFSEMLQTLIISFEKLLENPCEDMSFYTGLNITCGNCYNSFMARYSVVIDSRSPVVEYIEEVNRAQCPRCNYAAGTPLPFAYVNYSSKDLIKYRPELDFDDFNESIKEGEQAIESYFREINLNVSEFKSELVHDIKQLIRKVRTPSGARQKMLIKDFQLGSSIGILRHMAANYSKSKDTDSALNCYIICCEYDSGDPRNWKGLAAVLKDLGKDKEALEALLKSKKAEETTDYIEIAKPTNPIEEVPEGLINENNLPPPPNAEKIAKLKDAVINESKKYLTKFPDDPNIALFLALESNLARDDDKET